VVWPTLGSRTAEQQNRTEHVRPTGGALVAATRSSASTTPTSRRVSSPRRCTRSIHEVRSLCTPVSVFVSGTDVTRTHPLNGPLSGTTRVSRYQKGKTNLDFTEARDSEWQWHQLGPMQVCIALQTDSHASTPPLSFLQAGCPSCHTTNSVNALGTDVKR